MTSQASGASGVNIQTGARARKMSDGGRKPSSTVMCDEFDGLTRASPRAGRRGIGGFRRAPATVILPENGFSNEV